MYGVLAQVGSWSTLLEKFQPEIEGQPDVFGGELGEQRTKDFRCACLVSCLHIFQQVYMLNSKRSCMTAVWSACAAPCPGSCARPKHKPADSRRTTVFDAAMRTRQGNRIVRR